MLAFLLRRCHFSAACCHTSSTNFLLELGLSIAAMDKSPGNTLSARDMLMLFPTAPPAAPREVAATNFSYKGRARPAGFQGAGRA